MTQPEDKKPQSDLGSELRELGQQLEQAVRGTMESDRAKQMQSDISSGLKEIGAQLQQAMKAIQENPQVQQLVQRGEQAVTQAQHTKVAQDFQETLARGIAMLNDQLAGFVTRMQQGASAPPADDSAATGETTRLDPDKQ